MDKLSWNKRKIKGYCLKRLILNEKHFVLNLEMAWLISEIFAYICELLKLDLSSQTGMLLQSDLSSHTGMLLQLDLNSRLLNRADHSHEDALHTISKLNKKQWIIMTVMQLDDSRQLESD